MQLLKNLTIPVVVIVAVCLCLAGNISETNAAPQGSELYQEIKEVKHAAEQNIDEKDNHEHNSYLEHHIQIREAVGKAETLLEGQKKGKCGESVKENEDNGVNSQQQHHIQIREAVEENTERLHRVETSNNCIEVGQTAQDVQHKIQVRQTEQSDVQGESDISSDDLVASLIRQRDDFIAAAAIPEAPLPVQKMRFNLNSGL